MNLLHGKPKALFPPILVVSFGLCLFFSSTNLSFSVPLVQDPWGELTDHFDSFFYVYAFAGLSIQDLVKSTMIWGF